MSNLHVEPFDDPRTSTLSSVVSDAASRDAVVIDPVLDYDLRPADELGRP